MVKIPQSCNLLSPVYETFTYSPPALSIMVLKLRGGGTRSLCTVLNAIGAQHPSLSSNERRALSSSVKGTLTVLHRGKGLFRHNVDKPVNM